MLKAIVVLILVALATSSPVNPSLARAFSSKGTANIMVVMASGTQKVLDTLNRMRFASRADRLNTVASTLKAHAAEDQKDVLSLLNSVQGLEFYSLWISNKVAIKNADISLVERLAELSGIAEIHEEFIVQIEQPIDIHIVEKSYMNPLAEQGIELIQAHRSWAELGNNGVSAIVANIDTGVRGTHEALRSNFLGNYGWFDPAYATLVPDDRNGHGSHTMGTICGSNGIGVAPGAKWMACRGCATSSCSQFDLERCAQFIACPTLADGTAEDCSKAPHVVSNSWGGGQGQTWYNPSIQAWRGMGIIPVFSNGNSGPSCGSANSPADSVLGVIAVGATTFVDGITSFSSKGPSTNGQIKPDISAPGDAIRSSYHTSDQAYSSLSGTSMAAPHVAGVVALLAAEQQSLPYSDIERFLYQNTDRSILPTGMNCGGIVETTFPNNAYGWGRLNAFKAVQALQASIAKQ